MSFILANDTNCNSKSSCSNNNTNDTNCSSKSSCSNNNTNDTNCSSKSSCSNNNTDDTNCSDDHNEHNELKEIETIVNNLMYTAESNNDYEKCLYLKII